MKNDVGRHTLSVGDFFAEETEAIEEEVIFHARGSVVSRVLNLRFSGDGDKNGTLFPHDFPTTLIEFQDPVTILGFIE